MRIRKKDKVVAILFLLLLCLGIGYAYLTTNLSINGTSDITAANWNIKFQNIQVKEGSVTPTSAAAINANANTVTYTVTLTKPGDFYEFTVDAKNYGTIDGMVGTVTSTLNGTPITTIPDYLEYDVTYVDETPIENNHLLEAGGTETYKVHVGYKEDISANQLPATNQSLSLSFGVTYNQANNNAITRERYIYTASGTTLYIGEGLYPGDIVFYTPREAADANRELMLIDENIFLRHRMENDIITESYVGFVINDVLYYLKGGDEGASYNANKAILNNAFGTSRCQEDIMQADVDVRNYTCRYEDLWAGVWETGGIGVSSEFTRGCYVDANKLTMCGSRY